MRVLVTGGAGFIGANFVHQTVEHFPDADVEARHTRMQVAHPVRALEAAE